MTSTHPAQEDALRWMTDLSLLTQLERVPHDPNKAQSTDLITNAMHFLGAPYRRGGSSFTSGFDCSGFVRAIFERTKGLLLPRTAREQAASTQTISKTDLKPGDLVFFNTLRRAFSHVGIYVGEGKFIHAPRVGKVVRIEDMDQPYWKRRFNGARRVAGNG